MSNGLCVRDSPAWIDDDDLGILIRTYLPMEDYVRWLRQQAAGGDWRYAREYIRHPLVSYDDARALLDESMGAFDAPPHYDPMDATVRFYLAAHHKRVDEAMKLYYAFGPDITPEYVAGFAVDQLPQTHLLTCVEMVRDGANRLVCDQFFDGAVSFLATLQRVVAHSPEASRAAREAVTAILKEHPGSLDLRYSLNHENLITSLDIEPPLYAAGVVLQ